MELLQAAQGAQAGQPAGDSSASSSVATSLFLELLVPWFHNPVSALALCLWAQQYELATELTARFAAFEPTLDLLKQLDQLVHLIESPVFSRLRLRLLEPRRHPALLKCLLGLAMLLPQSSAFSILRERIHVVQSGLLLEAQRETSPTERHDSNGQGFFNWAPRARAESADSAAAASAATCGTDVASLLQKFDAVTAGALR